jgi:NitT/TauT family transport system permease protein
MSNSTSAVAVSGTTGEPVAKALVSDGWSTVLWRLGSFALVFGLWEILGRSGISRAFPPASDVLLAVAQMTINGEFAAAYADSFPPLLIGLVVTILGGVSIGVAVGLMRTAEWFFVPVLVIFQTAPVSAIIPLLTYMYGISDTSKVVAIVILGLPLVALNSYKGIQATSPSLIAMAQSFMASRLTTIRLVILPAASEMIFAGLRLGVSGAFIGIVLAELLITPTGIGDLITYNRSIARYDKMFAAIVSILAIAAVTLAMLQSLETRLFRTEKRR